MVTAFIDECQVERIIKERYKVTPVRIEQWMDNVEFSVNAVSSQNNVYTWRYEGKVDVDGIITSSKEFPFFYGDVRLNLYNAGIAASVANSSVLINNMRLDSITNFYNIQGEQLLKLSAGTGGGDPLPAAGDNITFNVLRNPHPVVSPFIQIQTVTDLAGAIQLTVSIWFKGYKVYLS